MDDEVMRAIERAVDEDAKQAQAELREIRMLWARTIRVGLEIGITWEQLRMLIEDRHRYLVAHLTYRVPKFVAKIP